MKTIHTLVEDIERLFDEDRTALAPERMADLSERLASKVADRLGEAGGRDNYLRMSSLGTPCERKLWYSLNTPEKATPLSNTVKIKFLYGDLIEEMLLYLAKEAGHTVEREQEEVVLNGVVGHIDGVIDGVLIDVKSASSYSFQKFKDGLTPEEDSFGYLNQLDQYLQATDISLGGFLAFDKQHAHIALDLHERTAVDWNTEIDRKRDLLDKKTPPKKRYEDVEDGKSGNRKLDVVCSYCDFKHECWPGLRTFLYSGKPRDLSVVRKEPRNKYGPIPELTNRER